MVTPELLDFIRAQISGGMAVAELERLLIEQGGWSKSDVSEALVKTGVTEKAPAPLPVAPPAPQPVVAFAPAPASAPQIQAPFQSPVSAPQSPEPKPAAPIIETPKEEPLVQIPEGDDFLGIFSAPTSAQDTASAEVAAAPLTPLPASEPLIHVEPAKQEIHHEMIAPSPKKEEPKTANLMEMLTPVSGAKEEMQPVKPSGASPVVKFDLSRIKASQPEAAVQTPTAPAPLTPSHPPVVEMPQVAAPLPDPLKKPIATRSLSEVWLEGKGKPQAADSAKEQELRASLSARRTMTGDVLLRGKGTAIEGLPSLVPPPETNPMPQYSSKKPEEAKAPEIKPEVKKTLALSPAEEIARKNRISRIIKTVLGAFTGLALIAVLAVAFIYFRGPNVSTLLATSMGNFFAASSFAYNGLLTTDLTLTSKSDGVTRDGAVKFALGYKGELKNDKYGYGDGNHHLKWGGGLSTGNFSWSTDVDTDLRMFEGNLYFHVLAFPSQSDIDPELFKTYWIKVDVAEIAKELALDTVTSTSDYNGIANAETSSFSAIFQKNMPFTGGEKIGKETVGGISTTHFVLTSDKEKMYVLATDLYKKYMGKSLSFDAEEKVRFVHALEKLKTEVWIDEKTGTIVQLKFGGDLDDDIGDIHAKGTILLGFVFGNYNAPIVITSPAPYLSLDELHTRMNDYKKFKEVRARDAVRINGLGELQHALGSFMSTKGRFPTLLSELRTSGILATSTLADDLFKTYVYSSYVKADNFTKANKCTAKSKVCAVYQIGVNLEDLTNPILANDADQSGDVRGADTAGCALEKDRACYDVVFVQPSATSTPR